MTNRLEGLPEHVIMETIKQKYTLHSTDWITRLKLTNGTEHFGFYQHVDGWNDLEDKNRFTFLPMNNAQAFMERFTKTQVKDPSLVIEIAAKDIKEIELVPR